MIALAARRNAEDISVVFDTPPVSATSLLEPSGVHGRLTIWSVITMVLLDTPLLAPITEIEKVPTLDFRAAVSFRMAVVEFVGDTLTLFGLIWAETPLGKLPRLRPTLPANPFADATVSVVETAELLDLLTVRIWGLAVIVKDPPGVTLTFIRAV